MSVLIVQAHPEPASFNAAMAARAAETFEQLGRSVRRDDLYAQGFDPVSGRANFDSVYDPDVLTLQLEEKHAARQNGFSPDLEARIAALEAADLLILQFPLWWFGFPAILKGWVDRCFASGRIYGDGRLYDRGVLRGKRAVLSLTTGAPEEAYRNGGLHGDMMGVLRPLHRGILAYVGYDVLAPHVVHGPARMGQRARSDALDQWARRLVHIEDEDPIDVGVF